MAGKSKVNNSPKRVPIAKVSIEFFPNEIAIDIQDWEKITVSLLERGINHLYKSFHQLRNQAVYERRKAEQEALKEQEEMHDA